MRNPSSLEFIKHIITIHRSFGYELVKLSFYYQTAAHCLYFDNYLFFAKANLKLKNVFQSKLYLNFFLKDAFHPQCLENNQSYN